MNLAENESRLVGMKFKALDELSNPDISGLGIIPGTKCRGTRTFNYFKNDARSVSGTIPERKRMGLVPLNNNLLSYLF